jgi:hypothetical protein
MIFGGKGFRNRRGAQQTADCQFPIDGASPVKGGES